MADLNGRFVYIAWHVSIILNNSAFLFKLVKFDLNFIYKEVTTGLQVFDKN